METILNIGKYVSIVEKSMPARCGSNSITDV
jgi:hypothetical protein